MKKLVFAFIPVLNPFKTELKSADLSASFHFSSNVVMELPIADASAPLNLDEYPRFKLVLVGDGGTGTFLKSLRHTSDCALKCMKLGCLKRLKLIAPQRFLESYRNLNPDTGPARRTGHFN
jgi:hypothetical protein